jgi:predicted glycosyltransferase
MPLVEAAQGIRAERLQMLATVAVLRTRTVASAVLTAAVTHQPLPTLVQVVAEAED